MNYLPVEKAAESWVNVASSRKYEGTDLENGLPQAMWNPNTRVTHSRNQMSAIVVHIKHEADEATLGELGGVRIQLWRGSVRHNLHRFEYSRSHIHKHLVDPMNP